MGWLARLAERLDHLDMAGRADLAAAWHLASRKDRALAALPEDTIAASVQPTTSGRLTSQTRQEAVLLDTLLDLDKNHVWIPTLVQRLDAARRNGVWGTTLENASALAALAHHQSLSLSSGKSEFTGTATAGKQTPFAFKSGAPAILSISAAADPIQIESRGTGLLYLTATTTGLLLENAVKPYDHQLQVRRLWTDRHGKPIDLANMKVGDLVQVEIRLQSNKGRHHDVIDNVAIVDALPGGMEIENPRLATSADADPGNSAEWEADHVEFLDDRIVLFTSADWHERRFRYNLRVVSAGIFTLPAIQASCMYNAGYASLHGGGRIEITTKKEH